MLAPVTLFVVLAPVSVKAAVILMICVPLIPVSIVAVQKFAKRLLGKYWGQYAALGDSFLEKPAGPDHPGRSTRPTKPATRP